MATQSQIDANRRNAQKSTGPTTPEGRAAVRHNALKHGLTAEILIPSMEDQPEFDRLCEAFENEYQPVGPTENHLVQQIIACEWRQHRAWAMEAALFDDEMTRLHPQLAKESLTLDQPTRAAHAWDTLSDHSNALQLLTRYEAERTRQELLQIQGDDPNAVEQRVEKSRRISAREALATHQA